MLNSELYSYTVAKFPDPRWVAHVSAADRDLLPRCTMRVVHMRDPVACQLVVGGHVVQRWARARELHVRVPLFALQFHDVSIVYDSRDPMPVTAQFDDWGTAAPPGVVELAPGRPFEVEGGIATPLCGADIVRV